MKVERDFATPLATGAFLLTAITGVLMFFHADSGLNKVAHEWLSWVLLAGVVLHVTVNFAGFKRHLGTRRGRQLIGGFAALLVLSFLVGGGRGDGPPFAAPVRALAAAPFATLAQVAQISPEQLHARLDAAGFKGAAGAASLADLVGRDLGEQMHALGAVFGR